MGYDIIGDVQDIQDIQDIRGHAEKLNGLLHKLGYRRRPYR